MAKKKSTLHPKLATAKKQIAAATNKAAIQQLYNSYSDCMFADLAILAWILYANRRICYGADATAFKEYFGEDIGLRKIDMKYLLYVGSPVVEQTGIDLPLMANACRSVVATSALLKLVEMVVAGGCTPGKAEDAVILAKQLKSTDPIYQIIGKKTSTPPIHYVTAVTKDKRGNIIVLTSSGRKYVVTGPDKMLASMMTLPKAAEVKAACKKVKADDPKRAAAIKKQL